MINAKENMLKRRTPVLGEAGVNRVFVCKTSMAMS
jgi:hypothetical protein